MDANVRPTSASMVPADPADNVEVPPDQSTRCTPPDQQVDEETEPVDNNQEEGEPPDPHFLPSGSGCPVYALSLLFSYLKDRTYQTNATPSWLVPPGPHPLKNTSTCVPYRAANGLGPAYIQDMVKPYTQTTHSALANRLAAPSLRARNSTKSRLFAVLSHKWWNEQNVYTSSAEG
ncbi:unnamed protein product [Pleuronectes platessa]|uniref:Uncharacterized protein n=1 Tax=Pleuronectes platessa TaxID=8262 RepID=A0A9N7VRQ5_PLEPL|nr:unnamed protein product [Pleuronectes platessa]